MIAQANVQHLPLADNSIDLIFTDPPYPKQYLPCYGWLAQEAARVLKPGGFVLAMCGGLWLNQIFRAFDAAGLEYFFEMQHKSVGDCPTVWKHYPDGAYPIVARCKSILAYSRGPGKPHVGGVMNLFENAQGWSKQFHHWGQDVASARYYIDYFSRPGQLVLDPFIGGGTTAVACELINRRCVGFDIDPVALSTTQDRLANADIYRQLPMLAGMAQT